MDMRTTIDGLDIDGVTARDVINRPDLDMIQKEGQLSLIATRSNKFLANFDMKSLDSGHVTLRVESMVKRESKSVHWIKVTTNDAEDISPVIMETADDPNKAALFTLEQGSKRV